MKVQASREELLAAAKDAASITPAVSPVDLFQCVWLEAEDDSLIVSATNGETAIERRVPVSVMVEGQAIVSAKLFAEMLRRLAGDTVTIDHGEDGRLCMESGSAEYHLPVQDAGQCPRTEITLPEKTVRVSGIPALVKRAAFAAAVEENKPVMKCVYLTFSADSLKAFSTDGFRIASAKGESKGAADARLLIPARSLERLAQLVGNQDELSVGVAGNTVVFSKENLTYSARLMDGKFADVEKVMAALKPRFTVMTDASALRKAVSAVCTVAGEQNRFRLSFHGSRVTAFCESEYGHSEAGLDVTALTGSPTGVCWFNARLLQECLRALNGGMMLDIAANGTLVMRTETLTCVQIAIREPRPIEAAKPAAKTRRPKEAA